MKKKKSKRRPRRRGLIVLWGMFAGIGAILAWAFAIRPNHEIQIQATLAGRMGGLGFGPGGLSSPRGIAVSPSGEIYVADLGNSRINVYSREGIFLRSFGRRGSEGTANAPDEFREPSGVAVDRAGQAYVADAWNGRIVKFDAKGKFLQEFSGPRYGFYSPRNVAVDAGGNFYVADTGNSAVKACSPSGAILKELGGRGLGGGRFDEVFGVAVNSKGEIFVADPGNQRIHKFSALPEGRFLKERKVQGWQEAKPFWPHLAADAQDRIFASDLSNRKIWVYDSEFNYLGTLGNTPGKEPWDGPLGLAALEGDLFVADMSKNQVLRLSGLSFQTPP